MNVSELSSRFPNAVRAEAPDAGFVAPASIPEYLDLSLIHI